MLLHDEIKAILFRMDNQQYIMKITGSHPNRAGFVEVFLMVTDDDRYGFQVTEGPDGIFFQEMGADILEEAADHVAVLSRIGCSVSIHLGSEYKPGMISPETLLEATK